MLNHSRLKRNGLICLSPEKKARNTGTTHRITRQGLRKVFRDGADC